MVTISPVGLSAAQVVGRLSILATYKEKLCRAICTDSTLQPQVSIVYTSGTPRLNGTTIFVPITATITIVTPGCGCKATTQLFTEKFVAAFQGYTTLPTAVTINQLGRLQELSCINCGKAHSVTLYDSLNVIITGATAVTPAA